MDEITKCLAAYGKDQLGRIIPQTFDQWAIAGVKNPKPLIEWYSKAKK